MDLIRQKYDLSVSWTRLRTFEECRQKAYLSTSKHRASQDQRNFFHGNVTDKLMRTWLADSARETGWMANHVEEYIELSLSDVKDSDSGFVSWRSTSDRQELTDYCRSLVSSLEDVLESKVLPYEFYPARRFRVPVNISYSEVAPRLGIDLIGEYDILVKRPDGICIYDLKATKDNSYWRKTLGQLYFYDLSILLLFGEPTVEVGLIQPGCSERFLGFTSSDEERASILARVSKYAIAMSSGDIYPKADSLGCFQCNVKHACPKYGTTKVGSRRIVSLLGE